MIDFGNNIIIYTTWTALKTNAAHNFLSIQYDESSTKYTIFTVDGGVVRTCNLYLDDIPNFIDPDAGDPPDQATNDSDKTDFENNYKDTANSSISNSIVQKAVLSNFTVTVGGSQTFTGYANRQVNLFINVLNAPTGTTPGLQFTIREVDPGDLATSVGDSVTGASITAAGTQEITLNLTTSSVIKVSWIIVGTDDPTFTGVYATLTSKPTTTISGVDANGVERILRPDSSGRLLVSGANAVSTPVTVDPIIIGGVNPGGVAGYSQLNSDNSLIVTQGVNKQPLFVNNTITSDGISNLNGLGVSMVNLFINIKNAPTGTNPGIIFSMYEIDPGDQSTPLGTSVTGTTLTGIGTQMLSLPLTSSGLVQVSWAVIGDSPSFSGVYVTAMMKDSNVVSGPAAIGSKMEGNPIINGAIDQSGNVQAVASKLVNGMNNMMVCDEKVVNKLDQIILLLMNIKDRGE